MRVKKPTRSEVEQEIAKCEKRIAILKGLDLDNLLPPHKGELALLKIKLKTIPDEN